MIKNTIAATTMGLAFLVGSASPAAADLCASTGVAACAPAVPVNETTPIITTATILPAAEVVQTTPVSATTHQNTASNINVNTSLFSLVFTMLGGIGVMYLMYRAGKKEAEANFNEYMLDVMRSSRQNHRNNVHP